ncbi:MAG TPA: methyl-accepting chemotaxis protein [Gemmatimonadales bacterium]|nr:methyl-accepting chemotaxis protein [Gemmatimonadales bacterium]
MALLGRRSRDRTLQGSLVSAGVFVALAVVLLASSVSWRVARRWLEREADQRLGESASRTAALVALYLQERRAELERLGAVPSVVAAAEAGERESARRNLAGMSLERAEAAMSATRSLDADATAESFLRSVARSSDFAELFVTESHGYVAVTTNRTSDFVQSDEEWWRRAFAGETYQSAVLFDSSAGVISLELAAPVMRGGRRVGVIKGVFDISRLARLVAGSSTGSSDVQVVSADGRLIVAEGGVGTLNRAADADMIPRADTTAWATVSLNGRTDRVATRRVGGGEWWVVVRKSTSEVYGAVNAVGRMILVAAILLAAVSIGALTGLGAWLNQRVTRPVERIADVASAVAQGDLGADVEISSGTIEVRQLGTALNGMVGALRRLVGAIRSAADEAAAMAAEISASTEQMAASGQEMSNTTQELSRRAQEQAEMVRVAAHDAARILEIAHRLAASSRAAAERNRSLLTTAEEYREQLARSAKQLDGLGDALEGAVSDVQALAEESRQISRFVQTTKAIATQTNMLALNAAIEANRAGEQGRGFAVVADEVRKLATQAAQASVIIEGTVQAVLTRVRRTHETMGQLGATAEVARSAARAVGEGLAAVSEAARENDQWSGEISASASESEALVESISQRLDSLAASTESFVASAQQIAASSEEQTAATQEIAASAQALANAADRLTGAIQSFRLQQPQEA